MEYEGEADCIGVHFEGNSAPQGSDVYGADSTFTVSPCPDGYNSTVDGTLDVDLTCIGKTTGESFPYFYTERDCSVARVYGLPL